MNYGSGRLQASDLISAIFGFQTVSQANPPPYQRAHRNTRLRAWLRAGLWVEHQRSEVKEQRQTSLNQLQTRKVDVDRVGQLTGLQLSPAHTSYWLLVTSCLCPDFSPPFFRVGGEFSSSSTSLSLHSPRLFLPPSYTETSTNTPLHLPLFGTSAVHMATLIQKEGGEREGKRKEGRKKRTGGDSTEPSIS